VRTVVTDLPLALYLHIPWCVQKCPYCDFNSHTLRTVVPETAYVAALLADLDFELATAPEPRPVQSIFFGGGTPSVFSAPAIAAILDGVRARLTLAAGCEITLEANPGTVEAARFAGYRAAGVNRLSMGVQSLNDAHLKALGRIHGAREAQSAYAIARAAGFDNINLDLMFALPRQTQAEARADLEGLIALAPEHISYYHLTLEPNTAFHRAPPPLPDDDSAYEMLEQGMQALSAAGYTQYETSAYARAGRQAAHNLNYWRFGDYLGIGAGAHGKRSFAAASGGVEVERRARHKHPKTYMERAGAAAVLQETRVLGPEELPVEFMLNALRLHEGFSLPQFSARTGLRASTLAKPLAAAIAKGLLSASVDGHAPTELGRAHLNRLLLEFMP
jgi:oxygen-independent coproporphyrinogen-3 oxidase